MEHGIRIRIFILISLFLSGIGICTSQNYSTVGEIWDFDIGDVFHYNEWGGAGGGGFYSIENIEIIDKTYSLDSSSVTYYQFIRKETEMSYDPYYLYEEYYEYLTKEYLNNVFTADTIYSDSNYNYRKQSHYDISQLPNLTKYGHYVDGCGHAFQYRHEVYPPFSSTYERKLIYYKKGDDEWGTPHILIDISEQNKQNPDLKVYPNPFSTCTNIEFELPEHSKFQISIFNTIGELVYSKEENIEQVQNKITWAPGYMPAGLYYAVLRSKEGVSVVKLVKQ